MLKVNIFENTFYPNPFARTKPPQDMEWKNSIINTEGVRLAELADVTQNLAIKIVEFPAHLWTDVSVPCTQGVSSLLII